MADPTEKKRLTFFDPTINAGHILTFISMVVAVMVSYSLLDKRVGVLEERSNTAIIQAAGTRGRKLLEGARETKIYGQWLPINAEIAELPMLSAQVMRVEGVTRGINFGCNKVRFTNMVPVGSKVRLKQKCLNVEARAGGKQVTMESTIEIEGKDRPADFAMLKVQATRMLESVAREAAQILGGASYITGSKVERIYREVRVNAIGGGSEEIMLDLAGRQLFGGGRK